MRLLVLRDHQAHIQSYLDMLCTHRISRGQNSSSDREKLKQTMLQSIQEQLYDSHREIFLFEKEGKVIGFSEVSLEQKCMPDEDLPESCLRIHSFYINSEIQEEKAPEGFFKLVKQWGRDKKASLVETSVEKDATSANEFFLNQGLDLIGSGTNNFYRGFV